MKGPGGRADRHCEGPRGEGRPALWSSFSLSTSACLPHVIVQLDQRTLQEHNTHKRDWQEHRDKLLIRCALDVFLWLVSL